MIRVIIAGGRDFHDYPRLKAYMDCLLEPITEPVEIVSGGANGADSLGERYARESGYKLKRFPANWDKYGKAAGPIRNKEMALYAAEVTGVLVAFWDGESRGTYDMITRAEEYNLQVHTPRYRRKYDKS
jgi:hypothetical protein